MRPIATIVLVGAVFGLATTSPLLVRLSVALAVMALIAVVCLRAPRNAVIGLVVWLAVLGTVRRLLLETAALGSNDPLLLVAPAVVAVLVVVAARQGAFRTRTRLTKAVMALSGLLILGTFNPLQGGIAVGLGGLLFALVPTLWFWVGRTVFDDRLLHRLVSLLALLAPLAALYGLYQVYRGFPPWDAAWVQARGYDSLEVKGAYRQFASFSSAAEYVGFLAIGLLVWATRLRNASRWAPAAVVIPLLAWSLAVASVRGVLVGTAVTLGVVVAVARGFGITRTAILGLSALVLLSAAVSLLDPSKVGGSATADLLERQVTGLSDPFDPESSTLPVHFQTVVSGILQAFRNPVGQGTGVVSIAADRFGSQSQITETDPSNVAVALGLPGLVSYTAVAAIGLRRAFRRARAGRDLLGLVGLGILLLTGLQWLTGGNYAIAPLPWIVLGWLDRPAASTAGDEDEAAGGSSEEPHGGRVPVPADAA